MLEVDGLELRRGGELVLTVPHLEIERSETLTVIGPNGAGKTALLLALALLQPVQGVIRIDGESATPSNALRLRRRMAVVFQEPLLLDTSVASNVAAGLKLRGMTRAVQRKRVAYWLERFEIAALAHRSARLLSGGEAQRVSLARAFALEPEVLFLDEPFSALDAPTRSAITADLLSVLQATRTTTLLVTHDRDEALRLGDRLAVMIEGRILQVGRPQEVLARPVSPEVAAFVGTETVLPGRVVEERLGLLEVEVAPEKRVAAVGQAPVGSRVLVCLRPEEVTLLDPPQATPSSARNRFLGVVTEVTDLGLYLRVSLDCGFPLVAYATRVSVSEMGISAGRELVASFKATAVHLIPH